MPARKRPKRVTIYEVAEAAGVSITTVSHALNRPERVRPETRERILRVADELDFVPNSSAVDRGRRSVQQVAVVAPFDAYPSYRERLMGTLSVLETSGAQTVIFDHSPADTELSPLMRALPISGRIDGLILMGIPLSEEMATRLIDRQIPTVLVDSQHPSFVSVNIDDEAGGRLLVEHLRERGHQCFAYVTGSQRSADYVSPGMLRLRGIENELRRHGAAMDAMPIVLTEPSFAGGRTATDHLLREHPDATAAICHFDEIAAGVLARLRELGATVPDDLAVIGYDDGLIAEALDITTIHQPFRESGEIAARILLDLLSGGVTTPDHVVLRPELKVRGST